MRLFNNKKGQEVTTSKVFYWLIGLIISVWLVYSIWGFGATFFSSLTQTPYQLSEDLFVARITNTCFSWTEQTTPSQTEVHPSILDLSKINNDRLAECFVGEDILPSVVVTVKPTPTNADAFDEKRAILLETDLTIPAVDILRNKKPHFTTPRYVLVKDIRREETCGLRANAIPDAVKQQDYLFGTPVLLVEQDFVAIKECIDYAFHIGTNAGDALATCHLFLQIDSSSYNSKPKLSDFCYSKTGACTYEDFVADYKGSCQILPTIGKLIPAELQVVFYD